MATSMILAIMPPPEPVSPAEVIPSAAPRNLTLYELEAGLQALLDTAEMVDAEQQIEFDVDLETALSNAVAKRDRTQGFLVHVEGLVASAAAEIKRLQARKTFFESVVERVEHTVVRTIRNLGTDPKGKYKTLQGEKVTFSVRRCPAIVAIIDEAAVPAAFKSITITMPALTWEGILDALDMETRATVLDQVRRPDSTVSKTAVKDAIEAAAPAGWKDRLKEEGALSLTADTVPGAAILPGGLSLVRK